MRVFSLNNICFYRFTYVRLLINITIFLIILLFNISNTYAAVSTVPLSGKSQPPFEIREGWLYKWGDSPMNKSGVPLWVSSDVNNIGWKPWHSNIGDYNSEGEKHIWIKTTLPEGNWTEPAILYRTIEQNIDVYLEGNLIYSYGNNNSDGKITFGSPWHLIKLPQSFAGKTLYIRVYSHSVIYVNAFKTFMIGSANDLLLEKSDQIQSIVRSDIDYVILSGLFIFIGIAMIYLYYIKRKKKLAALYLSFAMTSLGFWIFADSSIQSFVIDAPIVWLYIAYASIQLVPVWFCGFLEKIYINTANTNILKYVRITYIFYIPLAFLLDISGILSLMYSIKFFHIMLVITMFIILFFTIRLARTGNNNARITTIGFFVLSMCGIYDILDMFYINIPFLKGHHLTQWAMFVFILTQIYILERHYIEIEDKLNIYSKEIEDKNIAIIQSKKLLDNVLEYDKLKNEFIANISHELRTPLSIILGSIQLFKLYLINGAIEAERDNALKYVKSMRQNCYRLLRLVNNVIDITKIDSGHFTPSFINCDIVGIIKDITLSINNYTEMKGVALKFISSIDTKIISCDPDLIERVLLNLLSNAVKFTHPGDTITVDIHGLSNNIIVTVSDTGIGIPEEKLSIIFERFRQAEKTFTRSHEGSGIGLSIVKSLIEMHDGSITVESQPGKGSKFTIILPVRELPPECLPKPAARLSAINNVEKITIEFSDIYS